MKFFSIFTIALVACLSFSGAMAEVRSAPVAYKDGDDNLTGYLYWNDAVEGKRPGILVVHEWWGLDDYARKRAEQLAELGYVAFAADMYGGNKVTSHPKQAGEWMRATVSDLEGWRRRAQKGLDKLSSLAITDTDRMAAIGYCFGGATVMQLAYAGADLDAVVSFHGSLPLPNGSEAQGFDGKVLIEHGNADAFVPPERVEAFKSAMGDAGVDFVFNGHDDARHGFTNPGAGDFGIDNLKYDEAADTASWRSMLQTFNTVFD
ncbi:MAG: dienelactone hydrolase family protein [Pseudomonadota bacterium]